jgi:hypothetical protein
MTLSSGAVRLRLDSAVLLKGEGMMRRPGRCRPDRAHEEQRARAPPRVKDSLSSLIDDRRMVGRILMVVGT